MNFSKLWRILTCGPKKNSEPATESRPEMNAGKDITDDEPFTGLSEVASPVPVERITEEERERHESLDRNLSGGSHSHPHLSNN
ncbi:uncharacterized protein N7500_008313 [Penicillium coprophilum]|uniref:uncharacterized protein n=1 Tax=Penicillium coprophilum TaxID=36646 RepID=UPI00239D6A20|nr:uncharacterized protein N7500_008313 [Penicillium coprophilum]KAJ5158662.1 hypothetical protein N7500_008313 [Penicillium coprophilum]